MQDTSDSILMPVMNALAVFRVVARCGSIKAASDHLCISQSSLTRHIQKLEAHLKCDLFLRQNRRMELTITGLQLFEVADDALSDLARKMTNIREKQGISEIDLRCGHGFAHFWLFEHFPNLQRGFPEVQINLAVEPLGVAGGRRQPDLEVGLRPDPEEGRHSELLFPEEICLAASPEFIHQNGADQKDLQDLASLPLLHMDRGEYGIHWFGSYFAEFSIPYQPPRDTLYYNSYPHVVQAAVEGRGICLLWRGLNGDLLHSGALSELPGTALKGKGGYYLTCSKSALEDPVISRMRRWIVNGCAMSLRKHTVQSPEPSAALWE